MGFELFVHVNDDLFVITDPVCLHCEFCDCVLFGLVTSLWWFASVLLFSACFAYFF